jgi:hypothetical protein
MSIVNLYKNYFWQSTPGSDRQLQYTRDWMRPQDQFQIIGWQGLEKMLAHFHSPGDGWKKLKSS